MAARWVALALGVAAAACGGATAGGGESGGAAGGGDAPTAVGGRSGAPSGGRSAQDGGGTEGGFVLPVASQPGAGGAPEDEACVLVEYKAELMPSDLYVLLDRSTSMSEPVPGAGGDTWWQAAVSGLEAFAAGAGAAASRLGLQYFPLGAPPASCTADYATPDVPIAGLPAAADSVTRSLAAHAPSGDGRPLGAALRGTFEYLGSVAPVGVPLLVVVTHGAETECAPDATPALAELARAAWEGPGRIRTAVIELGARLEPFDLVAKAGGTALAQFVDPEGASDGLRDALFRLTNGTSMCDFALPAPPEGQTLNPTQFSLGVYLTPWGGAGREYVPEVAGADDCAGDGRGWYVESVDAGLHVVLCTETCRDTIGGQMQIALGCKPGPVP